MTTAKRRLCNLSIPRLAAALRHIRSRPNVILLQECHCPINSDMSLFIGCRVLYSIEDREFDAPWRCAPMHK